MNRVLSGLVGAVMAISLGNAALAQESTPSGTLTFSGGSVAVGVGYSWGGGTLSYQGNGLSAVDVGASTVDGSGVVYKLQNVRDFPGTYYAAGVRATLVGRGYMAVLENQHGVVIHFYSRTAGLKLTAAGQAVTVGLTE